MSDRFCIIIAIVCVTIVLMAVAWVEIESRNIEACGNVSKTVDEYKSCVGEEKYE